MLIQAEPQKEMLDSSKYKGERNGLKKVATKQRHVCRRVDSFGW